MMETSIIIQIFYYKILDSMERPRNTMELATGPETLTFPKIPSNADSMALAIKGNTEKSHISMFLLLFQSSWMAVLQTTPSACQMSSSTLSKPMAMPRTFFQLNLVELKGTCTPTANSSKPKIKI